MAEFNESNCLHYLICRKKPRQQIRDKQNVAYPLESRQTSSLNPLVNNEKLIRVDGRISKAALHYETKKFYPTWITTASRTNS